MIVGNKTYLADTKVIDKELSCSFVETGNNVLVPAPLSKNMSKTDHLDIIVVEDDPDLGAMIQLLLERIHYKVKRFEHPDKFLAFIEGNDPRLIIMDMLLSGGNGCELCGKLKKNPTKKHIKIIMISAHPDARKSCLEAGADAFIEKPFDIEVFIRQVKVHVT